MPVIHLCRNRGGGGAGGRNPGFVEIVAETCNLDPGGPGARRRYREKANAGLRPVGTIAVNLFGLPADYRQIEPESQTVTGLGGR